MKTFKDNAGRSWTIAVNVDVVKRVRSLVGINLLEAIDGDLIEKLATDPILLCDCVYAICKPEADQAQINDEDFGRAMAGDAIESATAALLEDLIDFFPQAKRRVLTKALQKMRVVEQRAAEVAEKRLESPELDAQIEAVLTNIGDSSGSLPESSASIPDH